jgi:hypothetical protein
MSLLQDKPMARHSMRNSNAEDPPVDKNGVSDFEDDFDLSAYQARMMNSDVAKQAAKYLQEKEQPAAKILLLFFGHKKGNDRVPEDWEKPIGLRVLSTISFSKMSEEFLKNKKWQGNIVLVCKGIKVSHGTPKSYGLGDQSRIGSFRLKWLTQMYIRRMAGRFNKSRRNGRQIERTR